MENVDGAQVGGCEVHYLSDTTAYLRWIYVNGDITGKGIGTKCMNALKAFLYEKGIRRFDTDTALDNKIAQHYFPTLLWHVERQMSTEIFSVSKT